MKVIIDIPEYMYNDIKYREYVYPEHAEDLALYIIDGTPLPKGHGRLIDADAMQKYQIDTFGQRLLVIDTAPTIIEADKEEEQ